MNFRDMSADDISYYNSIKKDDDTMWHILRTLLVIALVVSVTALVVLFD